MSTSKTMKSELIARPEEMRTMINALPPITQVSDRQAVLPVPRDVFLVRVAWGSVVLLAWAVCGAVWPAAAQGPGINNWQQPQGPNSHPQQQQGLHSQPPQGLHWPPHVAQPQQGPSSGPFVAQPGMHSNYNHGFAQPHQPHGMNSWQPQGPPPHGMNPMIPPHGVYHRPPPMPF